MPLLRPGTRRWWLLSIVILVAMLHLWLTSSVSSLLHTLPPGEQSSITRMEAAYVSELKLSAPPVVAPTAPAPRPKATRRPKKVASRPAEQASAPEEAPSKAEQATTSAEETASAVEVTQAVAPTPLEPAPAASAIEAPSGSASTPPTAPGPAFVWPLATRVSYKLKGYWRGDLFGTAKVEWVRQDLRYQVRLDSSLGMLGSRNLISEGDITPEGLSPRRYEEINRFFIKTSPPRTVTFEETEVVLDSGQRVKRLPMTQDGASFLIQLAYQFTLRPGLLSPGNTIELPWALTKRLEVITFDVIREELLDTPLGKLSTYLVRPRKPDLREGAWAVEVWFAPSLQYLPVRITLKGKRDKEDVTMDMQMDRAPEQSAAPSAEPTAAPSIAPSSAN